MKCKKCGFEFEEGIFCPECGTKNIQTFENEERQQYERIDDKDIEIDKVSYFREVEKEEKEHGERKVPWYLNGFFIIAVFVFTSFLFCEPAIILWIVRMVKCREKRKVTLITTLAIILLFFVLLMFL